MGTCFGGDHGSMEEIAFKLILFDEEVSWLQGRVDPKRRKNTFRAWRGRLVGRWGGGGAGIPPGDRVSEAGGEGGELQKCVGRSSHTPSWDT